ncbi:WD40 repeat domain-containing protein [Azomonas macrocytogenes]|uniref:DNA-binding beta-propeller fold protein YncE n=1 Tax=Azomonas macrocytogenes TaxID=69962 RepID=A0A839T1E0_AZOMA|nr:YncE family protein [Azomonas macrocytogenes]MBB3103361.1 DNA-binding beta-propeller fold protein YncE [Azomonas macrocytogenes]
MLQFHCSKRTAILGFTLGLLPFSVSAADFVVSANDGKYQRVEGKDTWPKEAGSDTLTVLDTSTFPFRKIKEIPVQFGIQGPPQAVAITPDGQLALVGAPTRYDHANGKLMTDNFLQVVDLQAASPTITKLPLPTHPQGIAINPAGNLALVAGIDGSLYAVSLEDKHATLQGSLKLSSGRLAGLSFTHDGQHALVALRDQQGVAVVDIKGQAIEDSLVRLSSGVAPYTIDVSSDGRWAVVSNVGLAGLAGDAKKVGDADTVSLIDVSSTPFKTVQYLNVPSVPESVAISPDGRWIAVLSMDGSNLPKDNPGRKEKGKLTLFSIRDGQAMQVSEVPCAEAGQGLVFTQDNRHIIAQLNVEKQLAIYAIRDGQLHDSGTSIQLEAGPGSLRTPPR